MAIFHPDLLARAVPRYTSYPTAADFHDRLGPSAMAGALAAVGPDEPVSLYLHIPFCREICWYCGCNTGASGRGDRLAAYLARLGQEIELASRALGGRGRVERISVGGGSPNAVAPVDFAALLTATRRAFAAHDAIVSVEIDPRQFDAEWSAMLAHEGVTRASLGVQTLVPAIQAAIGRVQPLDMVERSVRLLRDAGVTSLNFDLMYGLPGQTRALLEETLVQSIGLAPDRLAVFGYAHVPHLIARQRRIVADDLPDAAERFAQAELGHNRLTAAGYRAVGFDHFALAADPLAIAAQAGRLHRNFQGFTDDQANVTIGLGVSAISVFPDRLIQNDKHSGRYHLAVGNGRFASRLGCHRLPDDRFRATVIERILSGGSANAAWLAADPALRRQLAPFVAAGLVEWHGSTLRMAPGAMPYARSGASAFDRHRAASPVQLSRAV